MVTKQIVPGDPTVVVTLTKLKMPSNSGWGWLCQVQGIDNLLLEHGKQGAGEALAHMMRSVIEISAEVAAEQTRSFH